MKKIFLFATMFAISLSMLGQEYMHVWQDGKKTDYVVTEVDSVTFNKMMHNGHEYVDLGLPSGTLWATCNVGANKPEEYGDYFAWGEIEPKDEYSAYTYEWLDIRYETLTKYCINKNEGSVDNRTTLESCDDAAAANWGGNWRMPTNEEQLELINFCTYIWTTQNGISGYELTSKINGKSIFLPAAGSATTQVMLEGIIGYYWSCSLSKIFSKKAYCLTFMSKGAIFADEYTQQNRYEGASVRPITSLNQLYKSSQGEMHIWQKGVATSLAIADVDSVTFSGSDLTNPTTPNGGIGVFSVSPEKQVTFSKGNLQYTRSTDTWSFASTQWKMIGTDNVIGGSVYSAEYGDMKEGTALADEVDLFGWSTSSTNFGVSTSTDDEDYSGSFVDWGTNKIGNDVPNTWRTLTYEEWNYLRWERPNYSELCGVAQVNGVNGLIFLPDNWTCPAGVTFKSGFFHHSNEGVDYYAAYQTFTAEQWSKLEAAGAVFLPASGNRRGSSVSDVQFFGDYWSATENGSYDYDAREFYFYLAEAGMFYAYRSCGLSVRLVKDIDGSNTPNNPNDDPDNPNNPNDDPDDSDDPVVITGVTVKAKVPAHWIDLITVWVWPTGGEGEEFIPVREGDWYVYTHTAGTELNIIFKNGFGWTGAHNQTVDITGITQNTCIKIEQEGSGKATYTIVDCLSGEEDKEEDDEDDEEPEKPETPATGMENGYEYVDLGLSVKWATCNVGANKPEEYGDYFAWGETQPKSTYDWGTYKYCNGSLTSFTKYCTDSHYGNGTVDNKTTLELSDDAARANWGGSWRMPTDAELTELREQCTWTLTTQNGVYGYKVTSKKSGYTNKSIFLPSAGYRLDSSLKFAGDIGSYWSSSLDADYPYYAWRVSFESDYVNRYNTGRSVGFSVRPVCQ